MSVRKRWYLHIGLHKTGSTSVQVHLARNADALADLGLLYPSSARAGTGHAKLYWQLANSARFRADHEGWDDVLDEVAASDAAKVVISAEGLSMLEESSVGRLAELVGDLDPTIVVYLRRQDQLVQSVFAQRVKAGLTLDFPAFAVQESEERRYRFYDILTSWAAAFGHHALRIRVLEPEQLVGGDLVADFLDTIDASDIRGSLREYPRMNESATPEGLAVIRSIADRRQQRREFDQSTFAQTIGRAVSTASRSVDWGGPGGSLMTGKEAVEFLDGFADQNAKVARELLGRESGVLFRRQPDAKAHRTSARIEELPPAALVELLDRVVGLSSQ